ncbi:MAG: DNA-binding NarL/FixJ family response regulator [Verrucomicrobiales bacterium]|jgi:DNA-binding NarL/FixJ family response regulator
MKPETATKRIFLIDDHPLVRMGLGQILDTQSDLELCGELDGGRGAIEALSQTEPDAIILDLSLPDTGGIDLIKAIRAAGFSAPILVNSMHPETLYAERVLRAGANGYLMKQVAPKTVLTAIRKVLDGQAYLSDEMTCNLVNRMAGARELKNSVEELTDREFEVFELIGRGKPTADIAELLSISPRTVDVHRANIRAKLSVTSGAELAQIAVRWVESGGKEF